MKNQSIRKTVGEYLVIIIGCALYAAGFQFFLYPHSIVSGGVVGIAMIINAMFKNLPVGVMTIVMNIPLFLVAWRHFGTKFLVGSVVGTVVSSLFVDWFASMGGDITDDVMLACFIGGVIKGAGLGVIYYVGATTGGVDIIAKFLRRKYPFINFGSIVIIIDAVIIIAYAVIFNKYESAMYSAIAIFITNKTVDLVLYGVDNSCMCIIISEHSQQLIDEILAGAMHRGVTVLNGEGAYSHQEKHVIMCVIKRTQIAEIRRIVKNIDTRAFFIVTDVKNVFGKGFEDISEVK